MVLLAAVLLAVFVVPAPWGVPLVAAAVIQEGVNAWLGYRWSRRRRSRTGAEAMLGATAEVVERCDPEGWVKLDGELWRARADGSVEPGERVEVLAVDGLTLVVRGS